MHVRLNLMRSCETPSRPAAACASPRGTLQPARIFARGGAGRATPRTSTRAIRALLGLQSSRLRRADCGYHGSGGSGGSLIRSSSASTAMHATSMVRGCMIHSVCSGARILARLQRGCLAFFGAAMRCVLVRYLSLFLSPASLGLSLIAPILSASHRLSASLCVALHLSDVLCIALGSDASSLCGIRSMCESQTNTLISPSREEEPIRISSLPIVCASLHLGRF